MASNLYFIAFDTDLAPEGADVNDVMADAQQLEPSWSSRIRSFLSDNNVAWELSGESRDAWARARPRVDEIARSKLDHLFFHFMDWSGHRCEHGVPGLFNNLYSPGDLAHVWTCARDVVRRYEIWGSGRGDYLTDWFRESVHPYLEDPLAGLLRPEVYEALHMFEENAGDTSFYFFNYVLEMVRVINIPIRRGATWGIAAYYSS